MASRVTTGQSAGEAAWTYLAEQHPGVPRQDLSVLKLEQGWLIQTLADPDDPAAERLVLLVNRYGFVEEVGRNSVSRQNAHRYLSGMGAEGAAVRAS
jgi:hypothetical protein